MGKDQSAEEAAYDLQSSIDSWGRLLIASGGSLKPEKCFFYLISFVWKADGWSYDSNETKEEFNMGVPMPDGTMCQIEHLSVDTAKETLGVFTCPSGNFGTHLLSMKKQGQEWIDRAKESHLMRRDIWFLLDGQLWPKLGYGIGCVASPWKLLEVCLSKIWWQLIPMGGIIRTAPREVRQMSKGFYGAGCPHPGVECLVQQVSKFQTHYGCKTNMGLKMSASLELLIVELGVSAQPLQESFKKYKDWVTWTWLVSAWEKYDMFNVVVSYNEKLVTLPRERDQWLMQMFVSVGFSKEDLVRLNRVRLHQQALFLSCVLGASGKTLDPKYMTKRKEDEQWSTLVFPKENHHEETLLCGSWLSAKLSQLEGYQTGSGDSPTRGTRYGIGDGIRTKASCYTTKTARWISTNTRICREW